MENWKDVIPYKCYPFHGRIVLGLFFSVPILMGIFTSYHVSNTKDFSCNPDKNIGADVPQKNFIQTSCLSKYEEEYNSPISLPWSVFLDLCLVLFVNIIYSCVVKSRVERYDMSVTTTDDIEHQSGQKHVHYDRRLNRKSRTPVFCCYIVLLFVCIMITVIASVCFFQLARFPTEFSCPLSLRNSTNVTVECVNRLGSKNKKAAMATGIVNIVFALIALMGAIYVGWKVYCNKSFMSDCEFCSSYLLGLGKSGQITNIIANYKKHLDEDKNIFKIDIQYNPKGNLDTMFVNLIIQEGRRAEMYRAGVKRHEICDAYLKAPHHTALVHDIKDLLKDTKESPRKFLVIGRPGIGKSILSKKILLNWKNTKELGDFYYEKITVLLQFRFLNSGKEMTLKEMLEKSMGISALDSDEFCCLFEYMLENPEKVVLLFDGLDELKVDDNCVDVAAVAPNNHRKCMSIFSLWYKLISGNFLRGATVITTSRPTAHHLYSKLEEHIGKTLEILGFIKPKIEEYVQKFCIARKVKEKKKKIWSHIEASAELLSLCYIPANSYIVCFTLERCEESEASIPRTLTELYKRAVRILLWDHHPACKSLTKEKDHLNSDDYFPKEVIELLDKLKTLAVKGMKKNQLIFSREDIRDNENCGLFNSLPNKDKSQFCFLHLTLQEFLAAQKLVDGCNGSFGVEEVLKKCVQDSRWHLVIQFFAGLLGDKVKEGKLSENCYKCFSERIASDVTDREKLGMEEFLLMIKCLHELQDEEIMASSAGKVVCGKEHGITFVASDSNKMAPADCRAFSQFLLHIKNLHHLDLTRHPIGAIGCLELVKVFTNTNNKVAKLDLTRTRIADEGLEGLSEALKNENCNLTSLSLVNCEITGKGVKDLSEALKNENCKLTDVNLADNKITDEGVKDLSEALKNENCKLTSIDLHYCKITDEGVKDLSEALKNKNCKLIKIDLHSCKITDDGVKDLSEALKNRNCKLARISLAHCKVTDEGAKDLSEALKNENCKLTLIFLDYCKITDKGAKDLIEALDESCKRIRLSLSENRITDNAFRWKLRYPH